MFFPKKTIISRKRCYSCDTHFECYGNKHCWCVEYPPILNIDTKSDCFCSDCLHKLLIKKTDELCINPDAETIERVQSLGQSKYLKEGIDYYINENGLYVFKAWYLLRRGYCCNNGCLHCPYKKPSSS